jgi:2,5-diamino-6-(ribosylamino)-4(3H)-pyrimidinone 5'-phosphate reductase
VNRPHVIINCAASADGKIAMATRRQTRISSEEDLKRVHRLRSSVDAVLVGIGTILADDPHLTVKSKYLGRTGKIKNPIRVVIDSKGRIPGKAKVLNRKARTIVAVAKRTNRKIGNAEVIVCGKRGKVDLAKLMVALYGKGVRKLLVEGGGDVVWSFLDEKLADEFKVFVGALILGGRNSPTVADGEGAKSLEKAVNLKLKRSRRMEGGILLEYSVLK